MNGRCSPLSRSELSVLDSKSRSLPLLDSSSDGEQSYRLSAPPDTPPRLSPRPLRQGNGSSPKSERTDLCSRASSSHSLEYVNDSAVYHLAGRPGSPHTTSFDTRLSIPEEHADSVYAEVSGEAPADFTYEPIRGQEIVDPTINNTYEPLQDIRCKKTHSCCIFKVRSVFKVLYLKIYIYFACHTCIIMHLFTSYRITNGSGCSLRPRRNGKEATLLRTEENVYLFWRFHTTTNITLWEKHLLYINRLMATYVFCLLIYIYLKT